MIWTSLTEQLTRYTKPSDASTMAFILSVGVVGVVSRTCSAVKENEKRKQLEQRKQH